MKDSVFDHTKPTDTQRAAMETCREAVKVYWDTIDARMHDGPDKTFVLRKLREVAMWVNVGITKPPYEWPKND